MWIFAILHNGNNFCEYTYTWSNMCEISGKHSNGNNICGFLNSIILATFHVNLHVNLNCFTSCQMATIHVKCLACTKMETIFVNFYLVLKWQQFLWICHVALNRQLFMWFFPKCQRATICVNLSKESKIKCLTSPHTYTYLYMATILMHVSNGKKFVNLS